MATLRQAEEQRLSGVNAEATVTGRIRAAMHNLPQNEPHSTPGTGRVVRKPAKSLVDLDYRQLECRMAAILLDKHTDDVLGLLAVPVKEDLFNVLAEQLGYTVE